MGYENNFSLLKSILAFIGIFFCVHLTGNKDRPSTFYLHMGLSFIVVPSMVLAGGGDLPYTFIFITFISYLALLFSAKFIKPARLNFIRLNNDFFLKILLWISLTVIISIFSMGGGSYLNYDLSAVYDIRKEAASNLPGIFGYINPVLTKVIIPFGITIAILMQRQFYTRIFILCAVLMFGLTAHKAVLIYPLIVIFIYKILENKFRIELMIIGIILIGLISLLEIYLLRDADFGYWFTSIVFRRALLVPSLLNWFYIDWFSLNEYYFWAESKFGLGLASPPSELSVVNLIGSEYFGDPEMSANTGWIGSGYANAGIYGALLYSFLIGYIFSILDSHAKLIGNRLVTALFSIIALTILTSTDLTTSFITHGLLIALGLLTLISPIRPIK